MSSWNILRQKKWPEMVKSGQKWPEVTKSDQKWSKVTKSDQKVAESGQKWPEFSEDSAFDWKSHWGMH